MVIKIFGYTAHKEDIGFNVYTSFEKGKKVWIWGEEKWVFSNKKLRHEHGLWVKHYNSIKVELLEFEE